MRVALFVSVAINLLLVTSIVLARVDVSRRWADPLRQEGETGNRAEPGNPPLAEVAEGSSAFAPAVEGLRSISDYYALLRARGFSHEETAIPVAGMVLELLRSQRRAEAAYWEPVETRSLAETSAADRAALEDRFRADLLEIYADKAFRTAVFAPFFYPLGDAFASLDSARQIEISRWQQERTRMTAAASGRGRPAEIAGCGPVQSRTPVAANALAVGAAGLILGDTSELDDALAFELALRTSPVASRLRPLNLDEQSFREAFRQIDALAQTQDIHEHLRLRADLRLLLGTEDFDALWMQMDPLYEPFAEVLRRAGVTPHLIDAAWSVAVSFNETLLSMLNEPGPKESLPVRIAERRRAEHARLAELVGSQLATTLQAARFRPGANTDLPRSACFAE